jgi:hypothetical protein
MNPRKQSRFNESVIVALFISSILALYLVPAASAQGTVVIAGSVDKVPLRPGDAIQLGYEVAITDPDSTSTTVSVTNMVMQLSVGCPDGSSQTITINAPAQSFDVPPNPSSWVPSNSTQATAPPTLCGGKAGVESAVTFSANLATTCHANSAQGCCHNPCVRVHHKHGGETVPPPSSESCKPAKQCTSAQHGGCCKT